VSIILNVVKPSTFTGNNWPKVSIFGIYDGHGGSACAEYLRDNLHHFVIKDSNFPHNPIDAITKGFENAEKDFINNYAMNKSGEVVNRSGSCAIVLFIIGIK
jgi:protein phosphatase 2C family protein 2/3